MNESSATPEKSASAPASTATSSRPGEAGTSRRAESIHDFRTQCDRAVAGDRATREHVRKLEQEYDATAGEEQQSLPGGELDSEKLMRDLEDFLRKQREGGAGA